MLLVETKTRLIMHILTDRVTLVMNSTSTKRADSRSVIP